MSGIWGTLITGTNLAASISELERLNPVPHIPKEHDLLVSSSDRKHLSLQWERQIVNNLAFISATTKDPSRVMAVAVEESLETESMVIRLTSNTGDLSHIVKEFQDLAGILMQAARREETKLHCKELAFHQIVSMDLPRILTRLRSRHCTAKQGHHRPDRKPLIAQLRLATRDNISRLANLTSEEAKVLKLSVKSIHGSSVKLEALSNLNEQRAKAVALVQDIIRQTHNLAKQPGFTKALAWSTLMDPNGTHHIPTSIAKLAKYFSIATELVSAARDTSSRIFHDITVEGGRIEKSGSVDGRIHAEIQLLFFYEINPQQCRPRVICSSKSACYLCNLFFELHGSFHMPRTHGKIYSRWCLPDWLEVSEAQKQHLGQCLILMKKELNVQIKNAKTHVPLRTYHPNESVAHMSVAWPSSSVLSVHADELTLPLSQTQTPLQAPIHRLLTRTREQSLTPSGGRSSLSTLAPIAEEKPLQRVDLALDQPSPQASTYLTSTVIILKPIELPFKQSITSTSPPISLQIDSLSLAFDFVGCFEGQVSVVHGNNSDHLQQQIVGVNEIPSGSDMIVGSPGTSDVLTFVLRHASLGLLEIKIVWST